MSYCSHPNKLLELRVEDEMGKTLKDVATQLGNFVRRSYAWILLNFADSLLHLR